MRKGSDPRLGCRRRPGSLMVVIGAVFFVLASAYVSSAGAEQRDREEWFGICRDLSSMGGLIMKARQSGVAREVIVDAADGSRIMVDLTEEAFQAEIYSTDAGRQAAVSKFEDGLYQQCSKGAPFQ